jgi:hypothetical protein
MVRAGTGFIGNSLSCNLTANPLPFRARLVRMVESIHDDIDLIPYFVRFTLIRVLVEDKE